MSWERQLGGWITLTLAISNFFTVQKESPIHWVGTYRASTADPTVLKLGCLGEWVAKALLACSSFYPLLLAEQFFNPSRFTFLDYFIVSLKNKWKCVVSIFAITDGVSDVLWLLPLRGGSWNQLGQEHNRTKMATEGDEVLNRKKI